MSFFKKKQPKTTAKEVIEKLEKDILNAELLPDLGGRYLEISRLSGVIETMKADYTSTEKSTGNLGVMVIGGGAFMISGILVFFVIPPAGIVIGAIGGIIVSLGIALHTPSLFDTKTDKFGSGPEYPSALKSLLEKVSSKKDAIIQNHLLDLRSSSHFEKICDRFPDVANAFAKAAAKTSLDIPRIVRLDKSNAPKGDI